MPGLARHPASLLVAGLALSGVACELTSVELTDTVDLVIAEVYLRPGEDTHQAFLYRTFPADGGSLRVDGATIVVRGAAGEVLEFAPASGDDACAEYDFAAAGDGGSCYIAMDVDGRVQAGRAYDLEITLPDGRRLEGRTAVPAAFRLVRPASSTCVLESMALELTWTRSEGSWAYQADARFTDLAAGLAARGVPDPPDTLRLLGLSIGASDTTMTFPRDFGVFDRFELDRELLLALQQGLPEGARADIVVAAVERNYVNWARGGNFNPSGQVRVPSVTGDGTGVFAALIRRSLVVLAPGDRAEPTEWPSCE
jgi:hypothetical protein